MLHSHEIVTLTLITVIKGETANVLCIQQQHHVNIVCQLINSYHHSSICFYGILCHSCR